MEGLEWGRLGMLAVGIVVVVLVLLLLARSCSGSSAESKNRDYFTQVQAVLKKSDQAGAELNTLMHSRTPLTPKKLTARLQGIQADAQEALTQATKLKPTKQVKSLQPWLLQTLSYRVNGVGCMAGAVDAAYKAKPVSTGGKVMVPCTQRLLASDVIYVDSYYSPAGKTLQNDGIDVKVPTSKFLADDDVSVVTPVGMGAVLQRWKPGSVAHGRHGLQLDTVVAKSSSGKLTTLQVGTVNQVKVTGLTFLVTATNGGDFTEFDVPVKVTIGSGDTQIKKSAVITQIAKGEKQTVEISGFENDTPQFGKALTMTVKVEPVAGERITSNNTQTYQITFSL